MLRTSFPEIQGYNLVLTVLYVPSSLDSGPLGSCSFGLATLPGKLRERRGQLICSGVTHPLIASFWHSPGAEPIYRDSSLIRKLPSQGPYSRPYGGPRGVGVSYQRCTPVHANCPPLSRTSPASVATGIPRSLGTATPLGAP